MFCKPRVLRAVETVNRTIIKEQSQQTGSTKWLFVYKCVRLVLLLRQDEGQKDRISHGVLKLCIS